MLGKGATVFGIFLQFKLEFIGMPRWAMRARCSNCRNCPNPLGIVPAVVKLQFIGMRIATPVCGLVRNDSIFETFRTDLSAASH